MTVQAYAIIDAASGYLINLVLWDGDTQKWSPPVGTTAIPANDVDFSALPQPPLNE